jgi:rubrerythrin
MNVDAALRKLGDLERSLADLYAWYAEALAGDAEVSSAFCRMASEEKRHAGLVEYQRRMVQQDATLSVDVAIDLAQIEAALAKGRELRAAPVPPTAEEALREALLLERSAAESHYRNALTQANPKIARLLSALGGEDKVHAARLEELARRRGIEDAAPSAGGTADARG